MEELEYNFITYHCWCGRPGKYEEVPHETGGVDVTLSCPEHGIVIQGFRSDHGELDIGILNPRPTTTEEA
jgi:hypothetical protein